VCSPPRYVIHMCKEHNMSEVILHSVTYIPFAGYEGYVCYCGADAFSEGFRPVYQPKGTNLILDCEPIDPPWEGLSACNKCNRLSIVGKAQ
jgi:hypothetical protein